MAKNDLTTKQATSLAEMLSRMNKDSDEAQAKMERMFMNSGKLSRRMEKDLKKIQVQTMKGIKENKRIIQSYNSLQRDLTKEEAAYVEQLEKKTKAMEVANAGALKMLANQEDLNASKKTLTNTLKNFTSKLLDHASVMGVVSLAVKGIMALYNNWARLQEETTVAQARATQALGGTRAEMQAFQRAAEGMRGHMAGLEGDVAGITMSYGELTTVLSSLRMNVGRAGPALAQSVYDFGRATGVGTENASQLYRLIETGSIEGVNNLADLNAAMMDLASDIGANSNQIMGDFAASRNSIAQFGRDGMQVFHDAALMANQFGFETQRIFDMMKGFDTFSQASQNVNQLNSLLGTTLSSYELMQEQDPAQRLEMIRSQLMASGQDWDTMSRQARQSLMQITGQDENVLNRVFGDGDSLDEVREAEQRAAEERQRHEQTQISNQERLAELLGRTSVIFDTWQRQIQGIINDVSQALAPIWEAVHDEIVGLARTFRAWAQSVEGSQNIQEFARNIAGWIREAAQWLRDNWEPTWNRIVETWERAQPTISSIGGILMNILEFAADHPEVLATIFAVGAAQRFLGPLNRIAGMLNPTTGAIVAGAAIFAAEFIRAQGALDRINDRMDEIKRRQMEGNATGEETRIQEENRRASLGQLNLLGREGHDAESRFAASGIGQTGFQMLSDVTGVFNEELGASVSATGAALRSRGNANYRALAEQALRAGATVEQVYRPIRTAIHRGGGAALEVRRSLGISANQHMARTALQKIMEMDRQINPERYGDVSGLNISAAENAAAEPTTPAAEAPEAAPTPSSSAVDSAPVTSSSAHAQPGSGRGPRIEIRREPIILQVNNTEFARGQVQTAINYGG